ncbi:MAG: ankyrin repeat domain-containing protein [Planctomycetota bacterium]
MLLQRHVSGALVVCVVWIILTTCLVHPSTAAEPSDPNRYLNAVREFADNVLKYGRDTYGPKHTPLFVDGLNIHTHEPVKWIAPNGDEWILSNLASQQTLFRTLDGLTTITGDPKYRQTAMDAIRYAFDNLRSPNGLLYWGSHAAYNATEDQPNSEAVHELKTSYPYYKLMWDVNPELTEHFIEAFWSAHVLDWSNLDFNRHGLPNKPVEDPWRHEYDGDDPTFFEGKGYGIFAAATSLVQAGITLYVLSSQEQPLVWSKRLVKRFVDTRHPNTGVSKDYNYLWSHKMPDDLRRYLVDPQIGFIQQPFEVRHFSYPENIEAHMWISLFLMGEMLGVKGKEFQQWALDELTAWGKSAYREKDNSFIPMLTDGTIIEGYTISGNNDFGPVGTVANPYFADLTFFWAYTTAYHLTGDKFMWEMARNIGLGNSLGHIGRSPKDTPALKTKTNCSDVYGLLGLLELYAKTNNPQFLRIACRIGDNILGNQLQNGFFVPTRRHIYTRFDCYEPLALLHLHIAFNSNNKFVPRLWPSSPIFERPYRFRQGGTDRVCIYTLTESAEPPLSLQEAAAIGDVDMVSSLLEKGVGVDSWDDGYGKTALQRGAMGGHREVVELLLSKGAWIEAQADWPGGTALDYASEKGHKEVANLLIAKGADVNAARRKYPAGDTPLHSATRASHKAIADMLVINGADVNAKSATGETSLGIAVRNGYKDIAELLAEKGATISNIYEAAYVGDAAKVKVFLEEGVDVNVMDSRNRTPLHYAAGGGHKDIVELLIAQGAKVDTGSWTPLCVAVESNHLDVVEFLIAQGANVNVNPKWTPLQTAVARGRGDITELLIVHGADVNAGEWPPLHIAAYSGWRDTAELLIQKGASVNAKDNKGRTPLWYAQRKGYTEIVELLKKHGAKE